jgi:hypothetical protein
VDEHGEQYNPNRGGNTERNGQIDDEGWQWQKQHPDQDHKAERHDDIFRAQ